MSKPKCQGHGGKCRIVPKEAKQAGCFLVTIHGLGMRWTAHSVRT